MSDLRKAAQQALEALEEACGNRCNAEYNPCYRRAAADNLRAALAQPNTEMPKTLCGPNLEQVLNAAGFYKRKPEPPTPGGTVKEGEVYWYVGTDGKYYSSNEAKLFMDAQTKALYKDPPQWRLDKGDLIPLYTAPPQRQPLTKDEMWKLMDDEALWQFARAIEKAHGIE